MSATSKTSSLRKRRQVEMTKLIQQQVDSGQSVRQFCEKRGLSLSGFRYWKKRLGDPPAKPGPGFATLSVPVSVTGSLFAEVGGIKIFQPVSAGYLKELLS